jgi:hypothetical protein
MPACIVILTCLNQQNFPAANALFAPEFAYASGIFYFKFKYTQQRTLPGSSRTSN